MPYIQGATWWRVWILAMFGDPSIPECSLRHIQSLRLQMPGSCSILRALLLSVISCMALCEMFPGSGPLFSS